MAYKLSVVLEQLMLAGLAGDALVKAFRTIEETWEPEQICDLQADRRRAADRERKQIARLRKSAEPVDNVKFVSSPISPPSSSPPHPPNNYPLTTPPSVCERARTNADLVCEAVRLWNETAEILGLPKVQTITSARKRALAARLKTVDGIEGWKIALDRLQKIPWLHDGTGKNGWRANFDFLIQEKSFTKLMEGAYEPGCTNQTEQQCSSKSVELSNYERTILAGINGCR